MSKTAYIYICLFYEGLFPIQYIFCLRVISQFYLNKLMVQKIETKIMVKTKYILTENNSMTGNQ